MKKEGKLYFDTPDNVGVKFQRTECLIFDCPHCDMRNIQISEPPDENHDGETVHCQFCNKTFWIEEA